MTFADQVLLFYQGLQIPDRLPKGVDVLHPYREPTAFQLCQLFYRKFYGDNHDRFMILGINPGRFGGGITGVPFTDPVKLESICGIPNTLPKKIELSADFIHAMIAEFGGTDKFFSKFYINSVSPLGFTKSGKNMNYYDMPELLASLEHFIRQTISTQLTFGIRRDVAFCLGEGTNFKYLQKLNDRQQYFKKIIPLAHPRFIMQYKRKHVQHYIVDYLTKLNSVS
jgi:hypothetical protein